MFNVSIIYSSIIIYFIEAYMDFIELKLTKENILNNKNFKNIKNIYHVRRVDFSYIPSVIFVIHFP